MHEPQEVMIEVVVLTAPFEQDLATETLTQIGEAWAGARTATLHAGHQPMKDGFHGFYGQARAPQRNKEGLGFGKTSLAVAVVSP
jgi:hypothetical protein